VLKQIEADDQAIQTTLLGLPEDIYATVDSCETTHEIWLRVQQMMKGSDIGIQEKKGKNYNLVAAQAKGNATGPNGIQLQAREFDLMAAAADLDEIEKVNANCILMANLPQTSTSGTQTDEAPVYDSDGSAEEILDFNKQLSMEKSTVSFLLEEKKKLKSDFKIRKDELLDKQIQLEKKIKELDNILVKTGQSIQTMHMLSPKSDSFYHTEQKMALGY
nr:Gag-Pol polyprotein [Tanacetum cinerariifolium]